MKLKIFKFMLATMLLIVFVMTTCKNNSFLTYRQVRTSLVSDKVKAFVQRMSDKNGVYLLENDKKTMYFMLSRLSKEKNNRTYITDLVVKPVGDALTISYKESNKNTIYSKTLNKNLLYRIKLNKNFKEVKIFKNGKQTNFENVYF